MSDNPFEALKQFAVTEEDESNQREEGATAETFNDGKNYLVLFTFGGVTKAIEPEQARLYADDLLRAADEADAAMK